MINAIDQTVLKIIFAASKTIGQFFHTIKCVYTNPDELCKLYLLWLNDFINRFIFDGKLMGFRLDWVIDLHTIPKIDIGKLVEDKNKYPYEMVKINGGGAMGDNWQCLIGSFNRIVEINNGRYITFSFDWAD